MRWALPGIPASSATLRVIAFDDWWSPRAEELAELRGVTAVWQSDVSTRGKYAYRDFEQPSPIYDAPRNPLRTLHHLISGADNAAAAKYGINPRSIRRFIAGDIQTPDEVAQWATALLMLPLRDAAVEIDRLLPLRNSAAQR